MKFSVAVLTIPERKHLGITIKDLYAGGKLYCDYYHEGSWKNHKRALSECTSDYLLVLEDDILPCKDFLLTVDVIAGMFPDNPVSFFNMDYYKRTNNTVKKRGETFFSTFGVTGQAILYPSKCITSFLRWCDVNVPENNILNTCDARRWAWAVSTNTPIVVTVPNLVEHTLPLETAIKNSVRTLSKKRVSADFIGKDVSGMSVAWNPFKVCFNNTGDFEGWWREKGYVWKNPFQQ